MEYFFQAKKKICISLAKSTNTTAHLFVANHKPTLGQVKDSRARFGGVIRVGSINDHVVGQTSNSRFTCILKPALIPVLDIELLGLAIACREIGIDTIGVETVT